MDSKDREILNLLQKDDKISYKSIADKLDLAASTVHSRVKKLEEKGIIKSFSAIVDPAKVGYNTIAWLGLSVDALKMRDIAKSLAEYDEVQIVATSTGDHDVVVQLIAENEKKLWRFINNNIKTIEGVKPQMDVSSFIDTFKLTNFINLKKNKK